MLEKSPAEEKFSESKESGQDVIIYTNTALDRVQVAGKYGIEHLHPCSSNLIVSETR